MSPREIVEAMLAEDAFSQWLGVELLDVEEGSATIKMTVRDEMLNGFQISHGGIVFSLADSAISFSANTRGRLSVTIDSSVSYPQPVNSGDVLTATGEELNLGNRTALYGINITNQEGELVGVARGTVYRTSKDIAEEFSK